MPKLFSRAAAGVLLLLSSAAASACEPCIIDKVIDGIQQAASSATLSAMAASQAKTIAGIAKPAQTMMDTCGDPASRGDSARLVQGAHAQSSNNLTVCLQTWPRQRHHS
jgi:hypothetical protein